MDNIKFGTDGWRAITDKDFNEVNLNRVVDAIALYLKEHFNNDMSIPVLIGYDPRYKADVFSMQAAERLAGYGFNVKYSERVLPTPVLAYGAININAPAIMFTASHNPANYLGVKLIPEYAGPATTEITNEIIANLDKPVQFEKPLVKKLVGYDFFPNYTFKLKEIIDFDKIAKLKKHIIYDGLYSASIGYLDYFLDFAGLDYETLHMTHDPDFGGLMPDPKPENLAELIDKVKLTNNAIGVATDGDADRYGIINELGEFVTPNEIMAILFVYLKEKRGFKGGIIKTVAGSLMLDKLAQLYNVPLIETAVGFKHVGQAMRENQFVIGGEESGGLSIQNYIPEKDGIIAILLLLEALADSKSQSLVELQEKLYKKVQVKFFNDRIDMPLQSVEKAHSIINELKNCSNDYFEKFLIVNKDFKDGVKIYFDDKKSCILVRSSGTEPLLRFYIETDSVQKMDELKLLINKFLEF